MENTGVAAAPNTKGRKNGKNEKPIFWTVKAVEIMITYLHQRKGENSPMILNQGVALERLRGKLRPAFHPDDFARLRSSQIRDKLTHIWRKNRTNSGLIIKEFWLRGLAGLTRDTLVDDYPGIDLASIDAPSTDYGHSDDDVLPVNRHKRKVDDSEESAQPAKLAKKVHNDHGPLRSVSGNVTKSLPSSTLEQQSNDDTLTEDSDIEVSLLRSRDKNGVEIIDDDTTSALSSDDDIESAESLRLARSPIEMETPSSRSPTLAPMPPPRFPLTDPNYAEFCTPESINAGVHAIRKKIFRAVRKYLEGQGYPAVQPATSNLDATPSREMKRLLALIAGDEFNIWEVTKRILEELFSSENSRKLNLSVVIQGLLGAALQDWCLAPFSGTRWWNHHAMDVDVMLLLRHHLKELDYQAFRLKAIRDYIQNHFIPDIPRLAERQAKLFDQQLLYLLPERAASRLSTGEGMLPEGHSKFSPDPAVLIKAHQRFYQIPSGPSEDHKEAVLDEERKPLITRESQDLWIEDLSAIFRDTLKLRAHMEMPYDSKDFSEMEYIFEFPRYHDAVVAGQPTQRVMAGLFPKISACEKKKLVFTNQSGYAHADGETVRIVQARAYVADIVQ